MSEATRQRAAMALRMHAPELAHVAVLELGDGLDNAAFVAGDLVVRVAHGRNLVRGARLVEVVARHVALPVPAPRFVDEENGVLAYPLIAGRPLVGRDAPRGSARRLGRFLRELHAIDPVAPADLVSTEDAAASEWLEDLDGPPQLLDLLRASVPPPARQRVVAHGDLGAEHILEHNGVLTGVIDWSDAAITDPALDFARLYRDFGPDFLTDTLHAYGGLDDVDEARARIEFFARCAALEDLAYGRQSRRPEYSRAAERSLSWLFPTAR